MSDLRALLHEPWCQTCHGEGRPDLKHGTCPDCREDLATRLPECVPPGLRCFRRGGYQLEPDGHRRSRLITEEQAELLFIGRAVKNNHPDSIRFGRSVQNDGHRVEITNGRSCFEGEGETIPDALTAAFHRLADEREASRV